MCLRLKKKKIINHCFVSDSSTIKYSFLGGKVICNRWLDVILDCSNESGKIQFKKQGKQILPDAVIHMLRGECFKVLQCGFFFFQAYGEMNTASVRFEHEIE